MKKSVGVMFLSYSDTFRLYALIIHLINPYLLFGYFMCQSFTVGTRLAP